VRCSIHVEPIAEVSVDGVQFHVPSWQEGELVRVDKWQRLRQLHNCPFDLAGLLVAISDAKTYSSVFRTRTRFPLASVPSTSTSVCVGLLLPPSLSCPANAFLQFSSIFEPQRCIFIPNRCDWSRIVWTFLNRWWSPLYLVNFCWYPTQSLLVEQRKPNWSVIPSSLLLVMNPMQVLLHHLCSVMSIFYPKLAFCFLSLRACRTKYCDLFRIPTVLVFGLIGSLICRRWQADFRASRRFAVMHPFDHIWNF